MKINCIDNNINSRTSFQARLNLEGDLKYLDKIQITKLTKNAEKIGSKEDNISIKVGKFLTGRKEELLHRNKLFGWSTRDIFANVDIAGETIEKNVGMKTDIHNDKLILNPFDAINNFLKELHKKFPNYTKSPAEALDYMNKNFNDSAKKLAGYILGGDKKIPEETKECIKCADTIIQGLGNNKLKGINLNNFFKISPQNIHTPNMQEFIDKLLLEMQKENVPEYLESLTNPNKQFQMKEKEYLLRKYTNENFEFDMFN